MLSWLRPASALQRIQRAAALRRKSALPAAQEALRETPAEQEALRETRWSATSVLRFSRSPFAAWLDAALTTASGTDLERLDSLRDPPDGFSLLLARKGDAWERQVSKELFRDKDVVDLSGGTLRASGTQETLEALHTNTDIIYQAPLSTDRFVGAPDFVVESLILEAPQILLVLVDRNASNGTWSAVVEATCTVVNATEERNRTYAFRVVEAETPVSVSRSSSRGTTSPSLGVGPAARPQPPETRRSGSAE